jgi:phosphoheptose isomerase
MQYTVNLWNGAIKLKTQTGLTKIEAQGLFKHWQQDARRNSLRTVQLCENGHLITAWNLDTGYRHVYDERLHPYAMATVAYQ